MYNSKVLSVMAFGAMFAGQYAGWQPQSRLSARRSNQAAKTKNKKKRKLGDVSRRRNRK